MSDREYYQKQIAAAKKLHPDRETVIQECVAALEKIRPSNPRSDWTQYANDHDRWVTEGIDAILSIVNPQDKGVATLEQLHYEETKRSNAFEEECNRLRALLALSGTTAERGAVRRFVVRQENSDNLCGMTAWGECWSVIDAPDGPDAVSAQWVGFFISRDVAETIAAALSSATAGRETYTEICMNEKCPRGGRPVEVVRAPKVSHP